MKKIITVIIQSIIILFLILTIILGKVDFSYNENRYLQKFPSITINNILDGKFMIQMTNYVADHFPFREKLLNFKATIFKMIGVKRNNGVYYASDGFLIEEYQKPQNSDKIISKINNFISNNKANYSMMLVPTSSYIYMDKIPKYNLNYNEKETINYFKKEFNGNFIDVDDILIKNSKEQLFYKTDHHWTTLGAYYAYLRYCDNNGFVPINYQFSVVSNDFYGTLYSKILDNNIEPDSIEKIIDNNIYEVTYQDSVSYSLYNDSYLTQKDKYSYFLNGNQPLITIRNSNVLDNELLIIKDSYANSFVPFIVSHYSKVHIIDPRYYKKRISDYIKDNNITRVLFLYNVQTIDDDLGILSIN